MDAARISIISLEQTIQIALAHHRAGRLAESEGIYRQILSDHPNHADTLSRLGVLAVQTARFSAAEKFLRRAIEINPGNADYHCNLGESFRRCGKRAEAIDAFNQAIQLKPELAVAHNSLGIVLSDSGRLEEAVQSYRRAIQLKSGFAEAHNNLGVTLAKLGWIDDAIESYQRAIQFQPKYEEAYSNLGNALAMNGDHEVAVVVCRTAVQINPESVQAHWNLSVVLLRLGDFENGLSEYEWRWKPPARPRQFHQSLWDGRSLLGKTILLHAEQGFGDTIQFVRYVPMVAAAGGRVILECRRELVRMLGGIGGVDEIVPQGEVLPDFDVHCPLMSLPLVFGTRVETIPASVPYISADAEAVEKWRIERVPGKSNVGLVWAGKSTHTQDAQRSMLLSQFAPLAHAGVRFHSLQKGKGHEIPPQGMDWNDRTDELSDFAETAGLIANLDLVIAVDTAVAHLAAAMAKPVWILLPFLADWRWLTHRNDSPWYPTVRLFRQQKRGDWTSVIKQVADETVQLVY